MTARVIAVTGAVGAGKSTLCRLLEKYGARILNADSVTHEVLEQAEIKLRLQHVFGAEIISADGSIDRIVLGGKAFSDAEELKKLTDIIYPEIRQRIAGLVAKLRSEDESPIILEAPTLFEAECDSIADFIITVEADANSRQQRCGSQRGWTEGEVEKREKFLVGESVRRKRSQMVIENDGALNKLEEAAAEIFKNSGMPEK